MLYITYVVQQDTQLLLRLNIYSQYVWQLDMFRTYRLWNNLLTYGRTEQHTIFTYQTNNTQFIDAPEDGSVGPKHTELSNILWINIQP